MHGIEGFRSVIYLFDDVKGKPKESSYDVSVIPCTLLLR